MHLCKTPHRDASSQRSFTEFTPTFLERRQDCQQEQELTVLQAAMKRRQYKDKRKGELFNSYVLDNRKGKHTVADPTLKGSLPKTSSKVPHLHVVPHVLDELAEELAEELGQQGPPQVQALVAVVVAVVLLTPPQRHLTPWPALFLLLLA